jgi:hypothetical protein
MLRIGINENKEIQTKTILDNGYSDITSVCTWFILIDKKEYNREEAYEQIELFYSSLGSNVDKYNKGWYEKYLYKKNKKQLK